MPRMNNKQYTFKFVLLLAAILAPSIFSAAPGQPSAKEIFDKYIKACGGLKEFDKIKNRVTESYSQEDGQKDSTFIKSFQAKPAKLYSEYRIPQTGTVLTGTDGSTAWEITWDKMPKIKEGKEKEILLRECVLDKYVYWEKIFKNIEAKGEVNLGDKNYYKVVCALFSGEIQNLYFDIQSGFLVKVEMTIDTRGEKQPVEVFIGQYKKTGKITLPYRTQVHFNGKVKYTYVKKITNNAKLPKNKFDLPKEIKKLNLK